MTRTKSQTGKSARNKGKRGELEFASLCRAHGFDANRTAQCRGNTGKAGDVEGIPGVHIEVKRTEALRLYEAMAQSIRDAEAGGRGEMPIVAHRRNGEDWLIVLQAEDFFRLLGEKP